ncbi:MAG: aminomethyl-transferring glycine dehydrogenase [Ignavibacteria bacterium]|nr:aminomethyl-transferring glycine dehydrogenase [Ignavibacteria bacterium]
MKTYTKINDFSRRHIGPNEDEIKIMLGAAGLKSLEDLIYETIPDNIRKKDAMNLDAPLSEFEFLKKIKSIASKNKIFKSYIGMGYYPSITPAVILRNILENPGWYTQYTPYQAEISQGRLEALLNFQTMIVDFTGLPIANASLLDEGTAAAEAMHLFYAVKPASKKEANKFFVSKNCFPQTIDVVKTRAESIGIEIVLGDKKTIEELNNDYFGALVQYPNNNGEISDFSEFFGKCKELGILTCVATDLMSLALLTPPGEFGADAVVGNSQRFGVPMGFGGPHAAFFSTKEEFKRYIPGRIIGVTVDSHGDKAYRMALQTREQHIRREKATSNICTAQVLLAIMASMYAVYHGPEGIKEIASAINFNTRLLNDALTSLNLKQKNNSFFDTIKIECDKIAKVREIAETKSINFRYFEDAIGISLNEQTTIEDVKEIVSVFEEVYEAEAKWNDNPAESIPENLKRRAEFLAHPVFNTHHSETEMLRYMKKLENKDLSLTVSMIPLGSCTMKLNATTEMIGVTYPEFGELHPFAPLNQAEGYIELIRDLERDLCEITGFAGISLQPNSGAQGEYTGLLVIRAYHHSRGEHHRNVCLIPSSAHGTNPASAVMAGMKVVVVQCDVEGKIDLNDLTAKAEQHKENLSALMVTYPSTFGVFDTNIKEVCEIIHNNGGQVYMDGANMNAQVGLTSPAMIHADVCHLNLHKTFCIPHGGGGPGVGPIGVAKHLVEFLPGHSVVPMGSKNSISAVSSAPWGSASILIISYAYIKLMGEKGLTKATQLAILNANYLKARLEEDFKVLYKGDRGMVAHELIFDVREFKQSAGVEVVDIAKRLMDYGFHAPTVSFPIPGTLMVEPTESESLHELERFVIAMKHIRQEIKEIENGIYDKTDNVLKNAPHTAHSITAENWNHSYSREKAVYPVASLKEQKFFPSVGRVNDAAGDRNLICACPPIEEYAEETI